MSMYETLAILLSLIQILLMLRRRAGDGQQLGNDR